MTRQLNYRVSKKSVYTLLWAFFADKTHYHTRLLNATCYMIDTRILTINEEMAEIIEAKVGTSNIEII